MRCQFCGWDNPQGKDTCEKCKKPLVNDSFDGKKADTVVVSENHSRPTDRQVAGTFNAKATVREVPTGTSQADDSSQICPKCGYTLENGECSSCGYSVVIPAPVNKGNVQELRKTTRPVRKGEKEGAFTLIPISEDTGNPEGAPISYEGNEIILNRENTDGKNTTITSLEQAKVTFENGKWNIEDRSDYKTTFVQAAHKMELQSGDLILLGNQLYRFES